MSELKYICVQTAPGTERNPLGWSAEGCYTVDDGVVMLRDASGQSLDLRQTLKPGEDARAVARGLLRKKLLRVPERRHRGPIVFPKIGVA